MLPWLLLVVLSSAYSLNCSYVFDGTRYTRQKILTVDGYPWSLQIEPTTNDLIYSLGTLENSAYYFTGDMYILRNGTPVKIDINDAYVAASDFSHNRVFIGTGNGLKLLNNKGQAAMDILSFQNISIVSMFKPVAEDKLLIITNSLTAYELDLNTFEKSVVESIPSAWDLAVDYDGNIFYVTPSFNYRVLLKNFTHSIEFLGLENANYNKILTDDNNRVITLFDDGLYWLRPDSVIPEKLMDLDFVAYDIVFDNDDIYMSAYNTIYKFTKDGCDD